MSHSTLSFGESKTRCSAMVSSTTPEVGAEVAAGLGDRVDEEGPDLLGQLVELLQAEPVKIARSLDAGQQRHPCLLAVELIELFAGRVESSVPPSRPTPGLCVIRHAIGRTQEMCRL